MDAFSGGRCGLRVSFGFFGGLLVFLRGGFSFTWSNVRCAGASRLARTFRLQSLNLRLYKVGLAGCWGRWGLLFKLLKLLVIVVCCGDGISTWSHTRNRLRWRMARGHSQLRALPPLQQEAASSVRLHHFAKMSVGFMVLVYFRWLVIFFSRLSESLSIYES